MKNDDALRVRAKRVIPGGMYGHLSVQKNMPKNYPQYFSRAEGCRLWDVDDNEYIDFLCAFGPMIAGDSIQGALQERRELVPGRRANTFETTLGVDDLAATITAIEASGGKIVMPPFRIEGVGELVYFEDTEGNVCGAMQYEQGLWD
jgi:predicted enzyme related to lactoylglutathione lyase